MGYALAPSEMVEGSSRACLHQVRADARASRHPLVRTFTPENRQYLAERIEAMVHGIANTMRAEVDFTYRFGYPPTVNDPAMTEFVRGVVAEVVGEERVAESPQLMGAEDFSYFLERVPGCFWFVGSKNEERGLVWGHHHPRFDIDEAVMGVGIETMATTALRYLGRQ